MRGRVAVFVLLCFATPLMAALEQTHQTGPVGSVLTLEPETVVIGDVVTLTLRVTAEKDVELLMPEFGDMLQNFDIVDYSTNEMIDGNGQTIITQQYELQSVRSGEQSILPILIEYVDRRPDAKPAPDDMDAYEHMTERLDFEVTSVLPSDAKADLHPPLGELDPIVEAQATSRRWWPAAVAVGFGVVLLLGYLWMKSRRLARQRSAFEMADARLDALMAKSRSTSEELDAFFVELSAIVRSYLEDRFQLRAPELTTEEFLDLMARSPDMLSSHQDLLHDFLRRADLVKFARFVPTESDIEESIAAARRFLTETHEREVAHV